MRRDVGMGTKGASFRGAIGSPAAALARGATATLAAALLLGAAGGAQAESLFAREGLGEWIEPYDARGEALGSTGIGVIDPHNLSGLNPAAAAFSKKSMGYFGFGASLRWAGDGEAESRESATYVTAIGGQVALPGGFGVRLSLEPATDGTYAIEERVPTGLEAFGEDIATSSGSRGILRAGAAVTWQGGETWALAAGMGLYAGSLRDEIAYTFSDTAAASGWEPGETQTRLRFHPSAFFQAGALARPLPAVSVGAFLTTGSRLEVSGSHISTTAGTTGEEFDRATSHVELPLGYGLGAALDLSERWRLSGDLVWRQWEEVELDGQPLGVVGLGALQNTLRWGLGIERRGSPHPRAGYVATIAWRTGFTMIPWYALDAQGDEIREWRASFGAGLPVQRDRGSIDLVVSWGHRGDRGENGVDEDYLRFAFGSVFSSVPRGY